MKLKLILARAANGVIGRNNTLPWHLPEDMAHFKRLTMGCPVIMGRKTWESLPERFRPLPGRRNVVVSRQPTLNVSGAELANSLDAALAATADASQVFVIGGGALYAEALPRADRLVLTEVDAVLEGNTFFPFWDRTAFREVSREAHLAADGTPFAFVTYDRRRA